MPQSSLVKIPTTQAAPKKSSESEHRGLLQRCSCKNKAGGSDGECPECKKKREAGAKLQRKSSWAAARSPASTEAPPIVHEVLRSPGRPLDPASRAFMEPRFGYDFSRVRVHADARAAKSAEAVNAHAYTVGSNIVFGANQGGPENRSHQRILAHELAHVVQQGGRQSGGSLQVAPAHDSAEGAADRAADQVLSGGRAPMPTPAGSSLQRLGANPDCTPAQANDIHTAIATADGWVGSALTALAANPMAARTTTALNHNFGAAGVTNAPTIVARLTLGRSNMQNNPYTCKNAANDAFCASRNCGDSTPGGHASNICTNSTLASTDPIFKAGCVLHEAMHASDANLTVDSYSGWMGHSSATPGYPGASPLINADSYTTLALELA